MTIRQELRIRDELKKGWYWKDKDERINYYDKFKLFCLSVDTLGLVRSLGINDRLHSENIEEQITKMLTDPTINKIDMSLLHKPLSEAN